MADSEFVPRPKRTKRDVADNDGQASTGSDKQIWKMKLTIQRLENGSTNGEEFNSTMTATEMFEGCYDTNFSESTLEVSFDTVMGVNKCKGCINKRMFLETYIRSSDSFIYQLYASRSMITDELQKAARFFRSGPQPLNESAELQSNKEEYLTWHLWTSSSQGNTKRVQENIDLGANVNCFSGRKKITTPLMEAVRNGLLETCSILLKNGADVNLKIKSDKSAIPGSASWCMDDYNMKTDHFQMGRFQVPTACIGFGGETALMLAANQGNSEICKLILQSERDHGCKINETNAEMETALFYAVKNDHLAVCRALLLANVDINIKNKDGRNVLFFAKSTAMCELLFDHQIDPDCEDNYQMTPLLFALAAHNVKVAQLLATKADVCKKYPDETTMIEIVIRQRDSYYSRSRMMLVDPSPMEEDEELNLCRKLVTEKNCEEKCKNGYTPLQYAVWVHDEKLVQLLVDEYKADVNVRDSDHFTLLHLLASRRGWTHGSSCSRMLTFLLAKRVDVTLRTKQNGYTMLHLAALHGTCGSIVKFLEETNMEILTRLIEAVDKNGNTIFHSAVMSRDSVVCQFLIGKADIHRPNADTDTPLHIASRIMANDICQLLISHGANVHDQNAIGNTPLHVACNSTTTSYGNENVLRTLVAAGADVLAVNSNMDTPLHLAAGRGPHSSKFVRHLLQENTYLDAKNKDGNTPLHLAATVQNHQACLLLMKAEASIFETNKADEEPLDALGVDIPAELNSMVKKLRKDRLLQHGETKLDRVKLFLIGEPEAGKTTLKRTLITYPQPTDDDDEDDDDRYTPTAGIDLGQYSIEGAGKFSIWDYAGHKEFHMTHNLFLGDDNAIFLLAYDLSKLANKDKKVVIENQEKIKYWLSIVKAGNRPDRTRKPIVLLVGTHMDQIKDKGRKRIIVTVKDTVTKLQSLFKESLQIMDCTVALDCRKAGSEMITLISELAELGENIKENTSVPTLCEEIKKEMTSWPTDSNYPVITLQVFRDKVKKQHPGLADELVNTAVKFLHQMGVIYIAKSGKEDKQVVTNPQWFCNKVIGPAFARESFEYSIDNILNDKTEYTKEDFETIYPHFKQRLNELIHFLRQLDLIYKVSENSFVMPVRLPKREDQLWVQNDTMTVYYGRRIQCKNETDIFTADVFPYFQVAMMKKYSINPYGKPILFLNELKLSKSVEGYVELIPDKRAIQYYVRGRGAEQICQCQEMLEEIEHMIDQQLKDRSPGTQTTKMYLSSSEVMKLEGLHNVRRYTKEQLKDAIEKDGIVCHRQTGNTDTVSSIICKGYDMIFLKEYGLDCKLDWGMTDQANDALAEALDATRFSRDDYRGLAEACGISNTSMEQMEQQPNSSSISKDILKKWNDGARERGHTIGELLSILSTPGLVDNERAKTTITRMIHRYTGSHENQVNPYIPTGLSVKVLAHRAALKKASEKVCASAQPSTLWDHVQSCLPENASAKIGGQLKQMDFYTQMEVIISELLKLPDSTWWEPLMNGAQAHIAGILRNTFSSVVEEYEVFESLRSTNI